MPKLRDPNDYDMRDEYHLSTMTIGALRLVLRLAKLPAAQRT